MNFAGAPGRDFRLLWTLPRVFWILPGRPLSSPEGRSDPPRMLLNNIWVLRPKVPGSALKAVAAYFGKLPCPLRGLPGGTIQQNPRFL